MILCVTILMHGISVCSLLETGDSHEDLVLCYIDGVDGVGSVRSGTSEGCA